METSIKNPENKSVLFALLLIFISVQSYADETNPVLAVASKDNHASYYIIGGVLGFGFITFLINKIVSKYYKTDEPTPNTNVRVISHRNKHQHRIIKKSA